MPRSEAGPPNEQSRHVLLHGMGVSVVDFRCRVHVEPLGAEEPNPTHSIVFVRRGVFTRRDRDGAVVADPNHILYFNQHEPYRYAHPLPGGDDCTILTVEDTVARAVAAGLERHRARDGDGPFSSGSALITPRAAKLHHELLSLCAGDPSIPELAAQDVLAELVEEAIGALQHAASPRTRPSSRRRARRRDMVEAVKLLLSRSLPQPPSLTELAAAVSCSPFHLSRVFRATTGLPLRRYVRRLRAQLAADRLRRGDRDLTSLALELGFYDHSHFTRAFLREWGVPPSRLRASDRTRKYKHRDTRHD